MENKVKSIEDTEKGVVIVRFEDGSYTYMGRNRVIEGAYNDKETYYGYIITTLRDLTNLPKTYCHPYVNEIIHLLGLDKDYYIQYNIGKSKYCLNYHDGEKRHEDGSRFYDIFLTNNKKELARKIKELKAQGYTERMFGC